jgi:hypothetical protein
MSEFSQWPGMPEWLAEEQRRIELEFRKARAESLFIYFNRWSRDIFNPPISRIISSNPRVDDCGLEAAEKYLEKFMAQHQTRFAPNDPKPE